MLGHHIDTSDDTATLLARLLANFRNPIPEWLLLEILNHFSDHSPLNTLPRHLEKIIPRLTRLFSGGKLTRDTPRLQHKFELFLQDSYPVAPLSIKIKLPEVHRLHMTTCLEIMAKELRFNICEYPSSFVRNEDMLNLGTPERTHISLHLRYACSHWADQISQLETLDADLLEMVSEFFRTHFLHWLEVMSILALSPVDVLKNLITIHVCNSLIFVTKI